MLLSIGRPALVKFVLALGLCIVFASAETVEAQRGARGGRGRRGARGSQKSSPKPREQDQPNASDMPGVQRGQVYKFETVVDEEDADLVGILKVRPVAKGAKVLKLRVHNRENVRIAVGGHQFAVEMYPEILSKGLFCSADWGFKGGDDLSQPSDDSKKTKPRKNLPRELRALTFETLEIEGTILEIEDDVMVLKGKPKDDRQWPDIEARLARSSKPSSTDGKPPRVSPKKIRLKMLDGMTSFEDAARHALDLGDFEVEQQIEATIVFAGTGKKQGMLVALRSLTAEEREEDETQPGDKAERNPGQRGARRGARQRGRRGARPGGPNMCPAIVVPAVSQPMPAETSASEE